MVECGLPKAETRVRFPSPAPTSILCNRISIFMSFTVFKNRPVLKSGAKKSGYVCGCQNVILWASDTGQGENVNVLITALQAGV
jgi:hypothetical protein